VELEVTVLRQTGLEEEPTVASDDLFRLLENALKAACKASGYSGPRTEVNVLVTDDQGISRYHDVYLGDPSPTDVISFAAHEESDEPLVTGGPDERVLGDIVISEDTARFQAGQFGHTPEREMSLLVIHGFLHLVGYDDCDDESRSMMREMEQRALSLL